MSFLFQTKKNHTLKQVAGIILVMGTSISLLTACDRTEPDPEAVVPEVNIEQTEPLTAGKSVGDANIEVVANETDPAIANTESDVAADTETSNTAVDSTKSNQPSIVTSKVSDMKEGSPESVLAKAMNTIYYGNATDAAVYYQTSMPDFEQQLINTQAAFQKTVKKVTINKVDYNEDKTEAILKGSISLVGVDKPDEAEFRMQKIKGAWKILG